MPDARRIVAGYVYEIDGQFIPLDAIEVVHFRRWNPGNDFYGLSPIAAARGAVLSDRHMSDWNRNTFGQDQGVPAGVVNIRDFVSDTDYQRIKREWRAQYGAGARKTAFLRGGTVEWQHIGLSHTDLDFLQGRKAQRDEILNIFGIPVGLVSENATEANAKVAERQFIERTLYPKLVRLAQKISQELLPFYPGALIAEFDDIRPTDTEARLAEIRAAYPLLSINELRANYFQLPPVAWGEPVPVPNSHSRRRPVGATQRALNLRPTAETGRGDPMGRPSTSHKSAVSNWNWRSGNASRSTGCPSDGKPEQTRPFEVTALPDELAFEVSAGLLFARDREAVKSVFAGVRAGI